MRPARPLLLALPLFSLAACGGGSGGGSGDVGATFNRASGPDRTVWAAEWVEIVQGVPGSQRLVLGGDFHAFGDHPAPGIVRLGPDGEPDPSFDPGAGFDGSVRALEDAALGLGLWVGGEFTSFDGAPAAGLARVDADGALATGFDPGTGFTGGVVHALARTDDASGDVWVGGTFTAYDGQPVGGLARIAPDGTFVAGPASAGFDGEVRALAIAGTGDGDVWVGGGFLTYEGAFAPKIARIDGATAALDTSFDPGGGFLGIPPNPALVLALAVPPGSAQVMVGGDFSAYDGLNAPYLVRLDADGARDASFTLPPQVERSVTALLPAADGSGDVWVATGLLPASGGLGGRVLRLDPDGAPDATFLPPDEGLDRSPRALATPGDGDVVVGGSFQTYGAAEPHPHYLRLDPDAGVDSRTPRGAGLDGAARALHVLSDGAVAVTGEFDRYDGEPRYRLALLEPDGARRAGTPGLNGGPGNALAPGADSELYVAGDFVGAILGELPDIELFASQRLLRLSLEGALDERFTTGPTASFGPDAPPCCLAPAADGVWVAGPHTVWSAQPCAGLVRADASGVGHCDDLFAVDDVRALAPAGDELLWVGGDFDLAVGPATWSGIARIDVAGGTPVPDAAFDPGAGFDAPVTVLAPAASGALYAGGAFAAYDGSPAAGLVRLLADGSRDAGFLTGAGFDGEVTAAAEARDGSGDVYVAGAFTSYDGVPVPGLVRLDEDGALDAAFDVGEGFDDLVLALAPLGGGSRELYVAGRFTSCDGVATGSLVRLNADGSLD